MDTKDKDTELASTDFLIQGSTAVPPSPELLGLSNGDAALPIFPEQEEFARGESGEESPKQPKKSLTPFQESLRRLWHDKRAMISLGVVLLFVVLALVGPEFYQHIGGSVMSTSTAQAVGPDLYHNATWQELGHQDEFISGQNWLGTDALGRDQFARLMQGVLVSLVVALLVEVVDIVLGVLVGTLAGFYGGWIDQVLARFTDVMFAFPGLLFAILLAGIFGPSLNSDAFSSIPVLGANGNARLVLVSLALAIATWPLMARYVRGQTLQLKEQQFVEAARTSGTSSFGIILRHIVPNLFSVVVVAATLDIAGTIIGEAGLSFLGLGVQSPGSSLGLMISDATQGLRVTVFPWEGLLPCFILGIIVIAFSFFGDGLRDAFDPRSKD